MRLLALDTSAEACSVALAVEQRVLARFELAPQRHTERILPLIDALLAEAGIGVRQLDALAFGRGPGSFTGLRIAAGVAQGIALAADLPVLGISTLAALAQRCFLERGERRVLTAFDARMGEVYWAGYQIDDRGLAQLLLPEAVSAPERVTLPPGTNWFGAGSGWGRYASVLRQRIPVTDLDAGLMCRAEEMLPLAASDLAAGKAVSAELALPVYLRDRVAWAR